MQECIKPNHNKLYSITDENVQGVCKSNLPRLFIGDVVTISHECVGKPFFEKKGIKSFVVRVVKKLSNQNRAKKSTVEVGCVPECMLIPFKY